MKKIVIFGAGGFGREIQWLIESINEEKPTWELIGYIDDGLSVGTMRDGYRVLGGMEYLKTCQETLSVACAIGNAKVRKKLAETITANDHLEFPNLIAPGVLMSKRVEMGRGNLICAANVLTTDIQIGDFNILNLDCTIGHDVNLASYITVYPSANISGCVSVSSCCEIGTGTQIIQGIRIAGNVIIGAGSVVVKDLPEPGVYVGVPAKKIR